MSNAFANFRILQETDKQIGQIWKGKLNMLYTIREAKGNDCEQLCDLFDDLDGLHRDALPNVFQKPDNPVRTKESIATLMADENTMVLVADRQGCILGFVHAVVREAHPHPIIKQRRRVLIDYMIVRKDVRRTGVGQSLVRSVRQWAADRGIADVELNVWEFNQAAVAFWERMGFTTMSRRMHLGTSPSPETISEIPPSA